MLFIAHAFKGQVHVSAGREKNCKSLVLQDKCNIEIFLSPAIEHTVKPVLRGHLKIDKIKVFMDNGSLMEVESIAECSKGSILQYF